MKTIQGCPIKADKSEMDELKEGKNMEAIPTKIK